MQSATLALVFGTGLLIFMQPVGAQPRIYRCAGAGIVVYSDRPCEPGADPHEIDDSRVTVYTPAPTAERPSAAPSAKPSRSKRTHTRHTADPGQRQARCARLDQGLREVRTKMRTGYDAREGERLKARQRQLNEQRRAQKCG
jgi:hypothetical protein